MSGDGVSKKDPARGVSYFKKACDGGGVDGCAQEAWDYANGGGSGERSSSGDEALRKSVRRWVGDGLQPTGSRLSEWPGRSAGYGASGGVFPEGVRCQLDRRFGLQQPRADVPERPGSDEEFAEALRLYRRSCDANQPIGCNNAGAMFVYGQGAAQDDAEGLHMFRAACRLGTRGVRGSGFDAGERKQRRRTNPRRLALPKSM